MSKVNENKVSRSPSWKPAEVLSKTEIARIERDVRKLHQALGEIKDEIWKTGVDPNNISNKIADLNKKGWLTTPVERQKKAELERLSNALDTVRAQIKGEMLAIMSRIDPAVAAHVNDALFDGDRIPVDKPAWPSGELWGAILDRRLGQWLEAYKPPS